jgi:hypothetical protein
MSDYTESLQFVRDKIDSEGFDYAFRCYSRFEDVKDPEFHRLREAYVKAAEELDSYISDPEMEELEEQEDGGDEERDDEPEESQQESS